MKFIKLLNSRAGKMALSAMQAVGLSAAVGVAGVAAWQMLGASSQPSPNTVFSSNDQEVVFVAGAGGVGAYDSNYGAGGELQTSIRAKMSKDMELMQADSLHENTSDDPAFVQKEKKVSSYKMDGASGGLGMGANAANELAMGAQSNAGAVQQQIAALQASMEAQQKAAAAAGAATGNAAAAADAALQGESGGKWGMAEGMARASGNNLGATPLQAGQTSREGGRVSPSGVLGGAQVPGAAAASGTEGLLASRQSTSSFGKALTWDESDARMGALSALQKQSADVAQSGNRSVNEGTRIFMAAERLSGGIVIDGTPLTPNQASSSDFLGNDDLSSLGSGVSDLSEQMAAYEQARKSLREQIEKFQDTVGGSCFLGPICYAWIWDSYNKTIEQIRQFRSDWEKFSFEKTASPAPYADSALTVTNAINNYAWAGVIGSAWWAGKVDNRKRWEQVFGAE